MVLVCCPNLMWFSKISMAAGAVGVDLVRATQSDPPADIRGLLVDLSETEPAMRLIERHAGRIRIVAFGPHVEVETLAKAEELGADRVVSRGELSKTLGAVLTWLDGADLTER